MSHGIETRARSARQNDALIPGLRGILSRHEEMKPLFEVPFRYRNNSL